MFRNPYLEEQDERTMQRQALLDQMDQPEAPQVRPRPMPSPEQRDLLRQPSTARTTFNDPARTAEMTRNAYAGPSMMDTSTYRPAGDTSTFAQARAPETYNKGRGFEILDEFDDGYERRNEGAGGAGSGSLKGLEYGSMAGPLGAGAGAAIGAIAGAFSKNAKTAETDFSAQNATQMLDNAYRQIFRREPAPGEIEGALRGQGYEPEKGDRWAGQDGVAYILDQWAQQAAQQRQPSPGVTSTGAPPAPGTRATSALSGGGAGAPAVGAAAATGAVPITGIGSSNNVGFTGFNFSRQQDPSKSAKDAFAMIISNGPPITDTSKAGVEAYLRDYVKPRMDALGWEVMEIQGDKAKFRSAEKPEGGWADVMVNAGGDSPLWAWQDADVTSAQPASATAGGGTSSGGPSLAPGVSLAPVLGNSTVLQQILDEIGRLQRGEQPRDALLAQMGA